MDEDGFYVGELNGMRGMVPSNFLQTPQSSQQPQSIIAGGGGSLEGAQRPKGVAFSDSTKKPAPVRQSSQTSNKTSTVGMSSATGAAGSTSAMASKAAKPATAAGGAAKTLTKKSSDLGTKGAAASVARKSSQAAKKVDVKVGT